MNESEAVVIRVEGGHALVEMCDGAACGHCASRHACMSLEAPAGPRLHRLPNGIGARVGDTVVLAVPEGALLKAALLSYLWPALLTIAGAATGATMGGMGGDGTSVAGAGLGLMAGLASLRVAGSRLAGKREPLLRMRLKCSVAEPRKEAQE